MKSYKLVCRDHTVIIDELIKRMEAVFSDQNSQRRLNKLNSDIKCIGMGSETNGSKLFNSSHGLATLSVFLMGATL
ncbi:MAG: hypothetical protein WDZ91_08080 [Paenibacillaceae bacterium]